MTKIYADTNKYEGQATPPAVVEIFHGGIRDLIRKHFNETGERWIDFVFGSSYALVTGEQVAAIERRAVDAGYRYVVSATISAEERPDAYESTGEDVGSDGFSFEHPKAIVEPREAGRQRRGQGDNVVKYPQNVVGTARYFRSVKDVIKALTEGVPRETIAIIDDSGGTLTAPILEQFHGVICAGGTTKSHLGILTREFGIPCLMNACISGIRDGDRVEVEVSGRAKRMEDYQTQDDLSVRVWVLSE
tara:strand:+ start:2011 stop:2751 length:741 start_codon:yes stop_codon:yes gene_type:complete